MSSLRSVVLIGWFVFATASVQQQAHAQPAPAPPPIIPATDQVSGAPPVSLQEGNFTVGFQSSKTRFFVVSQDGTTGLINVTLIGTDGSTIGTPQAISAQSGISPVVEKIVADPPVAAWVGDSRDDLRVRILNTDGSPNGPEVVVDSDTSGVFIFGNPSLSRFVHNGRNYLLTWTKGERSLTGRVFGRILDVSNTSNPFASSTFAISSSATTAFTSDTAAVFDYTTSHYFVVYTVVGPEEERGVFGQLVKNDGTLVGGAFKIASGVALSSAVAFSPEATSGRFLAVWDEGPNIFGQRVDLTVPSGGMARLSLIGPRMTLNASSTTRDTEDPDIAYSLALGQYLVTWDSIAPTESRIDGRLVNFDGTMPRDPFTISVSPIVEPGDGGNASMAWAEPSTAVTVPPFGALTPNRFEYIVLWQGRLTFMDLEKNDLRFRFVDPHLDTDGDALLDDWETGGADLNNDGQIDSSNDINLLALEPNNPPNPQRKDVYLEIDWMDCALGGCAAGDQHNHRLRDLNGNTVPDLVEQMTATFARNHAPSNVRNPDGSNGITLHVDYGQLSGGNAIADDQVNIVPANIRATGIDRRRLRIFHYAVSTHACCGGADLPGQFFWAGRGGSERNLNDVIAIASNTFIHELGHTLGLFHGGGDHVNFKPNYLSVMNYAFSAGIPIIGSQTPLLDFSNRILLPLNETALNEGAGLRLASGNQATILTCPNGVRSQQRAAGAIDWNCSDGNQPIDAGNVMVDLNGDGVKDELQPFDNWSNLFFNFRVIGNFSSSAFVDPPPPEPLPSPEEVHQSLAPPGIQISVKIVPHVAKPGHRVKFVVKVENTGLGLAQNVTLVTKFDEQHFGRFSLGALPPGDSEKRKGSFIVPEECVPTLTFFATVHLEDALNEQLPSVTHSQEVQVICHDDE